MHPGSPDVPEGTYILHLAAHDHAFEYVSLSTTDKFDPVNEQ
jgi:hypothetical protein